MIQKLWISETVDFKDNVKCHCCTKQLDLGHTGYKIERVFTKHSEGIKRIVGKGLYEIFYCCDVCYELFKTFVNFDITGGTGDKIGIVDFIGSYMRIVGLIVKDNEMDKVRKFFANKRKR